MYIRRNSVFAVLAVVVALILSSALITGPFMAYAQEAATTTQDSEITTTETTTTETTPEDLPQDDNETNTESTEPTPDTQTQGNDATNVEPTGETFSQQSVVEPAATSTAGEGEAGQGNGQDGGDATIPGQEIVSATSTDGTGGQSDVGGTVITGDATATTSVQNELNSNSSNPDAPGETNSSIITASTTNNADLESVASSTATTGDNEAEGGTGLSTIVTGVAIATANVINVVNTNIFNSIGLIVFLNQLFGGGFDFRNLDLSYFFDDPSASAVAQSGCEAGGGGCESDCTLLTCLNSSSLNVVNTNTATVTNSVIVRASTGQNVASSTGDGGAAIDTGDAYAAANVLNLVNTNIINSKYLVVSFNNFGNLVQDVTLPAAQFFSALLGQGTTMPEMNSSTFDVNNTNGTDFVGTTTVAAETGNNTAITGTSTITDLGATSTSTSTPQGAEIETGNAYSMANSYTQANSNIIGATSLMMLFRVWGNWTGDIVGLPAGLKAERTQDGIVIMTDNGTTEMARTLGEYNSSSFLASSTNMAVVDNNVDVGASTGENQSMTENGPSTIETGDAYAVANVTNLVNTNVVNGNWIFGVFNVFGDWSGDIAFGHPDLTLEAIAVTPEPTVSGSDISYVFKVKNTGDMDAQNVMLKSVFDGTNLSVEDVPEAITYAAGAAWNLGTIRIGESREFAVKGTVSNPTNTTYTIPLTATVESASTDNDPHDNSKLVTVVVNGPQLPQPPAGGSGGGGGGGSGSFAMSAPAVWTKDPLVSVSKTSNMTSTTLPATIDYKVVVKNDTSAGPAYQGVLTDVLYDPDGAVVYQRSWNLETIASGDEITLSYSVEFASTTKPGTYRNVAKVTGLRNYSTVGFGGIAMSPVEATSVVGFTASGQVLGVESAPVEVVDESTGACAAYLNSFLARGLRNNRTEVQKLQLFLNSQVNAGLPITGTYGPLTTASVRVFQSRQGIRPTSGAVYTLTRGAINSVMCGGEAVTAPVVTQAKAAPVAKAPVKPKTVAKTPAKKATKPAVKTAEKKSIVLPKPALVPAAPAKPKGFTGWLKSLVPIVSAQSQ